MVSDRQRIDLLLDEMNVLRQLIAEYENGINWGVTCLNCSSLLDRNYGYYIALREVLELIENPPDGSTREPSFVAAIKDLVEGALE